MSKIDTIREKTEKQQALIRDEGERRRAADLGFDDIADYRLWQSLEDLRSVTLTRRHEREAERAKTSYAIHQRIHGIDRLAAGVLTPRASILTGVL